ncbi:MAG: hypothetical protein ACI8QS_002054 [Planctomycetota bacterium]|jgi:hypothetical protein
MKSLMLILWATVPLGATAYHLGPGQERLRVDDAAHLVDEAMGHVLAAEVLGEDDPDSRVEWLLAEAAYADALELLPEENTHALRSARLERSKCKMQISKLPEASAELTSLVAELVDDPNADPALLSEARRASASANYYMTWLTRLEGASREQWEPRIEASRQVYKQLVADAATNGSAADLASAREDLEAAVRLGRMDLGELQGLPLPSQ